MILFVINLRSISGDFALFSININKIKDTEPAVRKYIICNGKTALLLVVFKYESARRKQVIVTARVIAPFISMDCLELELTLPTFVCPSSR